MAANEKLRAKQAAKAKRDRLTKQKADNAAHRARKEAIKTRSEWVKECQAAFNRYIRARDHDKPCICCGRWAQSSPHTGGMWDCGHYRSVGSAPELRFDEDNAHRQLKQCNRDLSGRAVDYRIGLIKRIGIERLERIEGHHEPKKYSIDELKDLKAKYNRMALEIEKML
jgi:hypothetical protein